MSAEHHCLPLPPQPCPTCGEMLPAPVYCGICGAEISQPHVCQPHPLPHICRELPAKGRCLACGEPLPTPQFCPTCGEDMTPPHHCSGAPPTHVHRAAPVHICPVMELPHCETCGELLPPRQFCPDCGVEITPPHVCQPKPEEHVCPPVVLIPRRCSHCGELLPEPQHCTQCGADITPEHVCATEVKS